MLVSLPTVLARAKRQGKTILACEVATLEVAVAVLNVAEAEKVPIALIVDAQNAQSLDFNLLLDLVVHLAVSSEASVAVMAALPAHEGTLREVIKKGISAIYFHWGSHSSIKRKELTRWAVAQCHQHGVSIIGDITHGATPLKVSVFVQETGVQALFIPTHNPGELGLNELLTPGYLKELSTAAKIPLVMPAVAPSVAMLSRLAKVGVSMACVSTELEEAYTAGIRAGLHSRSEQRIATYQRKAMQAVESTVSRYLRYL
jgi:fructose/tagatose bisphosphate aldolase